MPKVRQHPPPLSDAEEARIQDGIARDPDNPEWSDHDFASARPFGEVFPGLAESLRRDGPKTSA